MTDDAIKPCPFCGFEETGFYDIGLVFRVVCLAPLRAPYFCCKGPARMKKIEAITAWNAAPRPTPEPDSIPGGLTPTEIIEWAAEGGDGVLVLEAKA